VPGLLACIGRSVYYWLALVLYGLSSEGIALYYQYVREEPPCVLCIQMRLLMLLLVVVALLVLSLRRFRFTVPVGHLLVIGVAVWMTERSYILLGTERGFVEGMCGFDLGLPSWFTPDRWLPALFEVQTSCGYTPKLWFGITMAEALMVASVALLLLSAALAVAVVVRPLPAEERQP
jgi:disulfide bond formation protein DsbB